MGVHVELWVVNQVAYFTALKLQSAYMIYKNDSRHG